MITRMTVFSGRLFTARFWISRPIYTSYTIPYWHSNWVSVSPASTYPPLMYLSLLATFLAFRGIVAASQPFNPAEYSKQTATCKALKRDSNTLVDINLRTYSISPRLTNHWALLGYVEVNPEAATTMIMAHGWPSLWSTWSYQIQEFKVRYLQIETCCNQ